MRIEGISILIEKDIPLEVLVKQAIDSYERRTGKKATHIAGPFTGKVAHGLIVSGVRCQPKHIMVGAPQ